MKENKKAWFWLWLSLLIVIIDQASKYLAMRHLTFGAPKTLLPFFNLNLNFNAGAAFSFLSAQSGWQVYGFAVISVLVVIGLLFWLAKVRRGETILAVGICLVIGGAVGNLIDRVRLKFVIDFADFHIRHWHFDTFNVADSAVSIGAVLLIIHFLFLAKK